MSELHAIQQQLPLDPPRTHRAGSETLTVLDLFTGLGGLALGFREAGFKVVGADNEPVAQRIYELADIGTYISANLAEEMVIRDVSVVAGGPPCRPWSIVNTKRRRSAHAEHMLLERFFEHVVQIGPAAFVMENVPALKSDDLYLRWTRRLRDAGYSVDARPLTYSDFGAASARRRLFTVGFQDSFLGASEFFNRLNAWRAPFTTVKSAISWLRDMERGQYPDHDWSVLGTIHKYRHRYNDGRYGWKQLDYSKPAPSFGSIAKTYILHPEAGREGFPTRVLSVREAMCIIGLPTDFRFPDGVARHKRYQMVANAVSPIVSRACAEVLHGMLNLGPNQSGSTSSTSRGTGGG